MQKNLKIAVVAPVLPERGGMGVVAARQALLLQERGAAVTVFTPAYTAAATDKRTERGTPIEFIKPVLQYGNAAWVPGLKNKLKGFDAVILHYPFLGGAKAVLAARKKYNFKLVVYYHMDLAGQGWKKFIFSYNTKFFLPRLIKAADVVATSSPDLGQYSNLGRYWQNQGNKFQVIPIGVDAQEFSFSPSPREPIILFTGVLDRAHYFKGLEYLLKAAPLIKADNFKIMIVGDGELRSEYEKLALSLGLKDKVIFAGAVWGEKLAVLVRRAAVTVLPSVDSESFGIVLVESMASGTPVVASALPGVRAVFENNVSGLAVPPRDSQALAEKIAHLLNNPEKARAMGASARRLVEEKYSWRAIGDNLENLITKLVHG